MTCDEAFELLTDPECRDRDELQRHLDGCPRCRQMQETLAPALALFDHAAHEPLEFPPALDCDTLFEQWDDVCPAVIFESDTAMFQSEVAPEDALFHPPDECGMGNAECGTSHAPFRIPDADFRIRDAAPEAGARSGRRLHRQALGFAGAFAAGVALAAGLFAFQSRQHAGPPLAGGFDQCTWLHPEQARLKAAADSRSLVLSCVTCHLEPPGGR